MNLLSMPTQTRGPQTLSKEFTRNSIELVRGGCDYFDRLKQMIDRAKETIHLQTYIYEDDETGKEIAERLISASKRGVTVYLLADGYASQSLSSAFIDRIRNAGIHFRFFEPVFKSRYFYFGRRLHHKIFVVDTTCALVGGINISNRSTTGTVSLLGLILLYMSKAK
jgi:cardiolipin synthase A/B